MPWAKNGDKEEINEIKIVDEGSSIQRLERIRREIETQMMILNMLVQFKDPFPSPDSPMSEIEKDKQKAIEYVQKLEEESKKIIELEKKSKKQELTSEHIIEIDKNIDSATSALNQTSEFTKTASEKLQEQFDYIKKKLDEQSKSVKIIKDRLSPKSTILLSLLLGFLASMTASYVFASIWPD